MRKIVGWTTAGITGFIVIIIIAAMNYITRLDVGELARPMAQPTQVLDRTGEKIYTLSVTKSEPVSISAMPDSLLNAVIAVEDRRFYDHPGVDLNSIARALYRDLRSGEFVEGGSTITQQLAKNAFLSSDKNLKRKLKEAAYALKIDMTYNKQEILERYLNTIYFGEGAWGVQAASHTYFGKDVKDLTLEEAALIAGLPKAPTRYSPVRNPEGAMERRNLVLELMAEQGVIDGERLSSAKREPVSLHLNKEYENDERYSSYIDAVIQEAIDEYGMTERELMSGGLVIKTEMDRNVQLAAADVFADPSQFPESEHDQMLQSGAAFIDQKTGGVRALMGSRVTGTYRGFNRATQLKRQPGSSFKPIAVYGPALEEGYTPVSKLYDGPLDIGGYRPENWDGRYHGEVTLTEAIKQSWNIPAVWLLDRIGIEKGLDFAAKLGVPLTSQDRQLGLALGGLSEGVSPLLMAQAFSTFADNGTFHSAHTIQSIEKQSREVIARYDKKPRRVMDPDKAYTMTLLLANAVRNGTGKAAAVDGWPTAGKTGTTELPETSEFEGIRSGAKDVWFAGYTPELTGAVWIGYDVTDRGHYLKVTSKAAASVFREIMAKALADTPPSSFKAPEGYRMHWQKQSGEAASEKTSKKKRSKKEHVEQKAEKHEKKKRKGKRDRNE